MTDLEQRVSDIEKFLTSNEAGHLFLKDYLYLNPSKSEEPKQPEKDGIAKLMEDCYEMERKLKQEQSSIGLKPLWLHNEQRLKEIDEAMTRHVDANKEIPQEWFAESESLTAYLLKRKSEKPKEVLFKDELGNDIYAKEKIWCVNKREIRMWWQWSENTNPVKDDNYTLFKNESDANNWIAQNKPKYSLKQIEEIVDRMIVGSYNRPQLTAFLNKLKEQNPT